MAKKIDISNAAAIMGSRGGKKSSANLTPEQRRDRALKAVAKREENRAKKNGQMKQGGL